MNIREAIRQQAYHESRKHRVLGKIDHGYRWRWGTRWGDMYRAMRVGDVVRVNRHPGSTVKYWGRKLGRVFSSTKRGDTWIIRRMA